MEDQSNIIFSIDEITHNILTVGNVDALVIMYQTSPKYKYLLDSKLILDALIKRFDLI